MNNLIQTGQWYWRDGEISYKDFTKLKRTEKDAYIELLLKLEPSQRSTGDKMILTNQRIKEKVDKFLEL